LSTASTPQRVSLDVLVVGGGGAAARAAVEAARRGASVRLVNKGRFGRSGLSATARSEILSIAAALGHSDDRDSPEMHYRDTMKASEGFCDPALVRVLAEDAPGQVLDLLKLGVQFERDGDRLRQGLSDFATYPRTCRVDGVTSIAILSALLREARRLAVPMDEGIMVADLIIQDGRVGGAVGIDTATGEMMVYEAPAVVLATGGVGGAFSPTLSDETMTGDGLAMAFRAGARLVNMEFHQLFPGIVHPITLVLSKPLYSLRPRLLNSLGEEFLCRYVPAGTSLEEVYREKVSPYSASNPSRYIDEGIYQEIRSGRCSPHQAIYYDFTHSSEEDFLTKAPNTYRMLRRRGIDPRKQPLEVGIMFQMINGGVMMVDPTSMTDVPGLFVAGETAGGVRGPDRPGGNSLAEGQVFGARAGKFGALWTRNQGGSTLSETAVRSSIDRLDASVRRSTGTLVGSLRRALQRANWEDGLVIKRGERLRHLLSRLEEIDAELRQIRAHKGVELATALGVENMALVSRAIALSALQREETRASHYREDFPRAAERWRKSIVVRLDGGQLKSGVLNYPDGAACSLLGT
jgi:succinate dehydrogenase/fumarate reductase flavoprotein subunit